MATPVQENFPICLADTVTLDLTKSLGDQKIFNSSKLSNDFACAIAIDSFRFFITPNPLTGVAIGAAPAVPLPYDFASILRARIRAGNVDITRQSNPVHIRMMSAVNQRFLNYPSESETVDAANGIFEFAETFFECVLPVPIYLGRNAAIDASIFSDAIADRPIDVSSYWTGVNVSMAAIGRLIPDARPGQVAYPYFDEVAAKLSVNPGKGVSSFASFSNPQFLNPFYNPLLIQRLNAALYSDRAYNTYLAGIDQLPYFPDEVLASLYDSRGGSIAGYGGGKPIPLGLLVDSRIGEWTFERNLDAQQWLNVNLLAQDSGAIAGGAGSQPAWFPRLSIVGTHLENFAP